MKGTKLPNGVTDMELTGNLKKQVEKAETKDEKKNLIENAGMLLDDDELEMVSGGLDEGHDWLVYCAGVGHIIPGCGFKLVVGGKKMARNSLKFYKNRCPTCMKGDLDVKQIQQ